MTIEQEIETYLQNNGLNMIPDRELDPLLARLVTTNKKMHKAFQKIARSTEDETELIQRLSDHHLFYELFENQENRLKHRINYLTFLSKHMDALPDSGLKIMEAGCATGIDMCFVAGKYPGHEYVGFDIDDGKIHQAKVRMKKNGLSNVKFTPGDYYKSKNGDLNSFDLIYTNSPLRGILEDDMIIEFADNLRQRVKLGGTCLLGGFSAVNPIDEIEELGFKYVKEETVYTTHLESLKRKEGIPIKAYFFERTK